MRKMLMDVAKNAPINGYVTSDNYAVMHIKNKYNVSDYYVVEVLEDMVNKKELEDLDVRYDKKDGHILSYKFK